MKEKIQFITGCSWQLVVAALVVGFFTWLVYGAFLVVVKIRSDDPSDFITGTVVSTSQSADGRFGAFLYVEDGRGEGTIRGFSTGAEGEGMRQCDKVRLYCDYDDKSYCEARSLLTKFIGTHDECQDYLLERGIISR
jgi:hypothetical protein